MTYRFRAYSTFDGEPINIYVVDNNSKNRKTGPMIQVYILPNKPPHVAQRAGDDYTVCGTCPLRPALGGGCYVVTGQGPARLHSSTSTVELTWPGVEPLPKGKAVRYGAYGDPAAVPPKLLSDLHEALAPSLWTGYTHAWRTSHDPIYRQLCMASCETLADAMEARRQGWRTYRMVADGPAAGEIACPYERSGRQCIDCGACDGGSPPKASVVIRPHGSGKEKAMKLLG